ncbi:hypothetical protein DFH09DRAFT_1161436, partial [Mycena vulgaris]
MSIPEAIHQLSGLLGDVNPLLGEAVIECATSLLKYERFKASISSPNSVVNILSPLNGGTGDINILNLLTELVPFGRWLSFSGLFNVHADSLVRRRRFIRCSRSCNTRKFCPHASCFEEIIQNSNGDALILCYHNSGRHGPQLDWNASQPGPRYCAICHPDYVLFFDKRSIQATHP